MTDDRSPIAGRERPLVDDVVAHADHRCARPEIVGDVGERHTARRTERDVAYALYIRTMPLSGDGTPVLVQFAKGDRTVPNPTASALVRAGDLTDRTSYFRNDLWAPTANPHTFLTGRVGVPPALQAQTQMPIFLASDGAVTIDPDGAGPLFEVPIGGPLPETLNF